MFYVRGLAISLSIFAIVYAAMSLAVCLTWQRMRSFSDRFSSRRRANLLFALRMFPLINAIAATGALAIPSFLLFEPRGINEPLGGFLLAAALCGLALILFGFIHASSALFRASRAISLWTNGARTISSSGPVPVLQISGAVPAMTAVGIVRPAVLLSQSALDLLTGGELRSALNHEFVHWRRRDNLRKLLLHFVTLPGMRGLESAWLEATEMAADDAAVSNREQALDLAAALIKLSRFIHPPAELTAALVHSPVSTVNARVERLLAWREAHPASSARHVFRCGFAALTATAVVLGVVCSPLLAYVHAATEWLVR